MIENHYFTTKATIQVAAEWHASVRHLYETWRREKIQFFILQYDATANPNGSPHFFQRLACTIFFHIKNIPLFRVQGNIVTSHARSLIRVNSACAALMGTINACMMPLLQKLALPSANETGLYASEEIHVITREIPILRVTFIDENQ